MKYCSFALTLFTLLACFTAFAGEPTTRPDKNPKNPKNPPPPVIPPIIEVDPPKHRLGVLATGGFGIEAEFVSDAFVKKDPTKKIPLDSYESDDEDDFSGGFEVFYEHVFSDPDDIDVWGLRLGLGYSRIEIDDKFHDMANAFTLSHDLDADLIHFSVGPFYEHRFSNEVFAQISAGLTAAYINADLSTEDSTGLLDADTSEDDFLFGAYASVALGYEFTPRWSILGGVRYQYLDSFEIDNGSTEADLDFDSSVLAFIGLRFAF